MSENIEYALDNAYNFTMTLTSAEGKRIASLLSQARQDLRQAPALDTARSWRFALISIACLLVVVVMGGYIIFNEARTIQIQDEARTAIAGAEYQIKSAYYQGVFDATGFVENYILNDDPDYADYLFGATDVEGIIKSANELVSITYQKEWHKSESKGFIYPGGSPEAGKP